MKSRFGHAWFLFVSLFRWYRVVGIGSLLVVAYFLVYVVLARTDVSWLLPPSSMPGAASASHFRWPDLPFFSVEKKTADGAEETLYTVPTRQITAKELASLPQTNRVQPARPK